jgi:tetratricopeptide (TPR) repeat protein
VALLLLEDAREPEAVAAYERWIASSRDRVGVSTGLAWLVRHYYATGKRERAEELARMAADVASYGGLDTLAHLLDASGRYEEAEATYREIASHYRDTGPLGTFLVRGALRTGDKKQELEGWENLRETFPTGMQPLAMHALDAPPVDGVVMTSFGRRVSAVKLEPTDIIVGVDDLRVRTQQQYKVATRLRHDEMMTLTVWRRGQYQQLRTRVPERWLGVSLGDHKGRPTAH